jgi:general secretion pathway protein C
MLTLSKNFDTKTMICRLFNTACLILLVVVLLPLLANAVATGDGTAAVERPHIQIRLVGTAVADDTEKSLAVFEVDGGGQTYRREGEIVGGVLVKYILPDSVIVDTGRGEEILKLRQSLFEGSIVQTEASEIQSPAQSFGPRPPENRNFQAVYLDREASKAVFADIDGVLKDVRIDPVSVYGQPTGVRVAPIAPGSVFAEIGLKSGDVVREVNGKAVLNPAEAVALLKEMKNGGEFDIRVKGRRSRQIHLIVE